MLGNVTLMDYETPDFTWVRGQACRIVEEPPLDLFGRSSSPASKDALVASVDHPPLLPLPVYEGDLSRLIGHEKHPVLVCDGEGEEYHPLAEEPEAWLRFAAAGLVYSNAKEERDAAVAFVHRYGLPRRADPFIEHGGLGLPLDLFLQDAVSIRMAFDHLGAVSKAEQGGDYKPLEELLQARRLQEFALLSRNNSLLFHGKYALIVLLNEHLSGVRLSPTVDLLPWIQKARAQSTDEKAESWPLPILPRYSCENLLSAMWLQVYFTATERRLIRDHCKGCGRAFEARDKRQEFCDPSCRNATKQRAYYRRQKAAAVDG
jgi:hypothetical protein